MSAQQKIVKGSKSDGSKEANSHMGRRRAVSILVASGQVPIMGQSLDAGLWVSSCHPCCRGVWLGGSVVLFFNI